MYCNLTPGKDQNLIFVIGNISIELMRVSTMYTTVYGNIVIDSWLLYNKNNGRNFNIHLVQNLSICQCHTTTTLVHGVESLLILYAWNSSANRMKVKIYLKLYVFDMYNVFLKKCFVADSHWQWAFVFKVKANGVGTQLFRNNMYLHREKKKWAVKALTKISWIWGAVKNKGLLFAKHTYLRKKS